jgi:sigma-E factor negative regulatory protein RseB
VGSAVPLVLLAGLVGLVPASAATSAPAEDDDARAITLLRRAVLAASTLGYTGTQVLTAWRPGADTARLVHVEQWPDGRRVETLRDADVGGSSSGVRSITLGPADTDLSLRSLDVLVAGYDLSVAPGDRVAGRAATLVTARRGDVVAARLWLDDASGLLLRQEVNDARGNVRRMFCFVDLRLGAPAESPGSSGATPDAGPAAGDAAPPRPRTVSGALVRVARVPAQRTAWRGAASAAERQSWCDAVDCPGAFAAGYRLIDASRGSAGGSPVLQLVYGDGLSSISVFVQSGRLDPGRLRGFRAETWDGAAVYVGDGWPTRLAWQGGSLVLTAVGDAPVGDLQGAVAAFPHDPPEADGVVAALGRGMRSVLEWLQGN